MSTSNQQTATLAQPTVSTADVDAFRRVEIFNATLKNHKKLKRVKLIKSLAVEVRQALRDLVGSIQHDRDNNTNDKTVTTALLVARSDNKDVDHAEAALALLQISNEQVLSNNTLRGLMMSGLRPTPQVGPLLWTLPKVAAQSRHITKYPHVLPLPLCSQPDVVYKLPSFQVKARFSTQRPAGPFSLLSCIMSNPEIFLSFVKQLPWPSLIGLYAISKSFHFLFNRHYTTYILAHARYWVGTSSMVSMPWTAFPNLTLSDPIMRDMQVENLRTANWHAGHWKVAERAHIEAQAMAAQILTTHQDLNGNGTDGIMDAKNMNQDVGLPSEEAVQGQLQGDSYEEYRILPSLRYLRMLIGRYEDARVIATTLFYAGHLLNFKPAINVMLKMGLLMELKSNANRIGLIHNRQFFTTPDIVTFLLLMIKIDMFFGDSGPVYKSKRFRRNTAGRGRALRQTLFTQRSLHSLVECMMLDTGRLNPTSFKPYNRILDLWRLLVKSAIMRANDLNGPCLDLQPGQCGSVGRIRGNIRRELLLRPDELVVNEAIYRKIASNYVHVNCLLMGLIGQNTIHRPILIGRRKFETPQLSGNGSFVVYGQLPKIHILSDDRMNSGRQIEEGKDLARDGQTQDTNTENTQANNVTTKSQTEFQS